eukprot:c12424_g2_i1.p1 GENE.c12424_g2_i1~~c12424_g2_i1.p1  ORF type:complete len:425 (-),score=89.45 c12424_g2_i1:9-1283(-)
MRASFRRHFWLKTSTTHILEAQQNLLNHFVSTHVASSSNPHLAKSMDLTNRQLYIPHPFPTNTKQTQQQQIINYIDTNPPTSSLQQQNKPPPIVLAHGFGSGLGFFFHNIPGLLLNSSPSPSSAPSQAAVDRVLAFDWLGMGASSRPACRDAPRIPSPLAGRVMRMLPSVCQSTLRTPTDAVNFFVNGLEQWRQSLGLEKFVLIGHSLGGYLAARYALAHPHRLSSLVLASPAGLVELPPHQDQVQSPDLPFGLRLIDLAWSANVTPQQIVRALGPKGEQFVNRVVRGRFGNRWNDHETNLIASYLYHITVASGSGEFAMNSLLQPVVSRSGRVGVFAREPIASSLASLGQSHNKVPVLVLYGDRDWLYHEQVESQVQAWRQLGGVDARVEHVTTAGHHLYLDNHDEFNQRVLRFVSEAQVAAK